MTLLTLIEAPEKPSATVIAARVLEQLDALAASWGMPPDAGQARDNLVRAVGFALMRDAFHGTHAADAGFDLVDAVEQLARMSNRLSMIEPEIHSIEAADMADEVAQAAHKVAADLAKARGAM
jgi:hypothetical protein